VCVCVCVCVWVGVRNSCQGLCDIGEARQAEEEEEEEEEEGARCREE